MLRRVLNTTVCVLAAIAQEPHNEAEFLFPEEWLDRAHDSEATTDLDVIADLERLLEVQTASRHYLLAAPKFMAVVDPRHEDQHDTRRERRDLRR